MRKLDNIALVYAFGIAMATTTAAAANVAEVQPGFPTKAVRLLVPSGAGSATDTMARTLGAKLSERWGQPVVVDSRPGGGGTLATNVVAKSTADGHTLLLTSNFAINAAMQSNLPYDPLKDFTSVGQIGLGTGVVVVAPVLGVKSVKDLVALAKNQPGKVIFASGPAATAIQLSGAKLIRTTGIKVVTVVFKGSTEAIIEVLAGRAHYAYTSMLPALPFLKEGKLLALAVSTPKRLRALSEVPTLAETLPDFVRSPSSYGLLAPAGTPRPVLNKISKDIARVVELPDIAAWFQSNAIVTAPSTPEEYDRILREQIALVNATAKTLGLRTN